MSKEELLINNPKSNNSEVMSNKQIEEMTEILKNYTKKHNIMASVVILESYAEELYNKNFRKQSKGEWEKRVFIIFDSEMVGYKCSECNTTWDTPTNYCPNCGASMKGGAE